MAGKYKNTLLIILFSLLFSVFFFGRMFFCFTTGSLLSLMSKKNLGTSFAYESIRLEKSALVIRKCSFKPSWQNCRLDVQADELCISISLDRGLCLDVNLVRPHVFVSGDLDFFVPSWKGFSNKESLLRTRVSAREGIVELAGGKQNVRARFSLTQPHALSLGGLQIDFEDGAALSFDLNREKDRLIAGVKFNGLDCSLLQRSMALKQLFCGIEGRATGLLTVNLTAQGLDRLFFKGDFSNLEFTHITGAITTRIKEAQLEIDYPILDALHEPRVNFLPSFAPQNARIRFLCTEGSLTARHKGSTYGLEHTECRLFYNPGIGPKLRAAGQMVRGNLKNSYTMEGKGFFQSKSANWLDFACQIDAAENPLTLSLKISESSKEGYRICGKTNCLAADHILLLQILLRNSFPFLREYELQSGLLHAGFVIDCNQKGVTALQLCDLSLSKMALRAGKWQASCDAFIGSGSLNLVDASPFETFTIDCKTQNGQFSLPAWQLALEGLNAGLTVNRGFIKPSIVSGYINKAKTDIELNGAIVELNANAKVYGPAGSFLSCFKPPKEAFKALYSQTAVANLSFKRKDLGFFLYGNMELEGAEKAVFGLDCAGFNRFWEHFSSGWFRAEEVNLHKWSVFLGLDCDGFDFEGMAHMAARLQGDKLLLQLKGQDFLLRQPHVEIFAEKIGSADTFLFEEDNYIALNLDLKTKQLRAMVPAFTGRLYVPSFDLDFAIEPSKIVVENNRVAAFLPKASCRGLELDAKVIFDYNDDRAPSLQIVCDDLHGGLGALRETIGQFGKKPENDRLSGGKVKGRASYHKIFDGRSPDAWAFDLQISEAAYAAGSLFGLQNICAHICGDSLFEKIEMLDAGADLTAGGQTKGRFYVPYLQKSLKDDEAIAFDCRLRQSSWDIVRLKGEACLKEGCFAVSLDKDLCRLYDCGFEKADIVLDPAFSLKSLDVQINLKDGQILAQKSLLFGLFGGAPDHFKELLGFEEGLKLSASLDVNGVWRMGLDAVNFKIGDKAFAGLSFLATKQNDRFHIDSLRLDDLLLSFALNAQGEDWKIEELAIKNGKSQIAGGSGSFKPRLGRLDVTISELKTEIPLLVCLLAKYGDIPQIKLQGRIEGAGFLSWNLPENNLSADWDLVFSQVSYDGIKIGNKTPINVHFDLKEGLFLHGLDLSLAHEVIDLSQFHLDCKQLQYSMESKKWQMPQARLYVPYEMISFVAYEKGLILPDRYFNMDIVADIAIASDLSYFRLSTKEIALGDLKLKDLSFTYNENVCDLDFRYCYRNNYYLISNHFAWISPVVGQTSIFEPDLLDLEHPLTVRWSYGKSGLKVDDIHGAFSGLEAAFYGQESKSGVSMIGSVKIDFKRACKLVPPDFQELLSRFDLQKGYELRGTLCCSADDFLFTGIFSGKQFEFGGFVLKTLLGKVSFSAHESKIEDLKISDSSGIITINKILLEDKKGPLYLTVPQITVKEFRPSLLQKIGKELDPEEIQPLVIRNLNIYDFQGEFDKLKTITGRGSLNFINSFKRDHTVFDIPADVLGRIFGLDLELLTPVVGHLDFVVRDGKFILTELKDTYSEGGRSNFFLDNKNDEAYLDFDGNLDICIRMKQYVLFKFTEKLVFSLTGSLNEPKLSLRKKSSFFSR